MITWEAHNDSTIMVRPEEATSTLAAIRAGRKFVNNDLYGTGILYIMHGDTLVRKDEKSIRTGYKWQTTYTLLGDRHGYHR